MDVDARITELLLSGEAGSIDDAEERVLEEGFDEILRLVRSSLSDDEFRSQPLIALLLSRGSRPWEDSIA